METFPLSIPREDRNTHGDRSALRDRLSKTYISMTKRVWTRWAHQVLQQGGQLLGEGGELDEGRPQVGVVPADEVAAKFVQSLGVVFFILNVVWVGKKEEVNY